MELIKKENKFQEKMLSTIGVDFRCKTIKIEEDIIKLAIVLSFSGIHRVMKNFEQF